MTKSRLEAFSDGVIAILITIMVLELKVPHGADWAAFGPLVPVLLAYVLSCVLLGIYWNNHHHMLHATERVNGRILWANLHLLFWLSLIPFGTSWMGETGFARLPTAAYGGIQFMAGLAYWILSKTIVALHRPGSRIAVALGRDVKGVRSLVAYTIAVPLALVNEWLAIAIFVVVALMWLVPDARIEGRLS